MNNNEMLKEVRHLKEALEKGFITLGQYEELSVALSKGISEYRKQQAKLGFYATTRDGKEIRKNSRQETNLRIGEKERVIREEYAARHPDHLDWRFSVAMIFIIIAGFLGYGYVQIRSIPNNSNQLSGRTSLSVPSDPRASYFVLEKDRNGSQSVIVTKRVGSSGTSYSKRLYSCSDGTVKYLGTGDSLDAMSKSMPDPNMGPIVEGSITYYVGLEACN
jgi:hypothetical protein